jgi:hypothetical protein
MARAARPAHGNDAELFRIAEPYTLRDFPGTIIALCLLLSISGAFMLASFYILEDAKAALLAIMAMVTTLLAGGGLAALFSPISSYEETRFPRMIGILGGVVSGFTLAKIDVIFSHLQTIFPGTGTDDPLQKSFLVLAPFGCFLIGALASFVLRTALVVQSENRLQVRRRRLFEEQGGHHV